MIGSYSSNSVFLCKNSSHCLLGRKKLRPGHSLECLTGRLGCRSGASRDFVVIEFFNRRIGGNLIYSEEISRDGLYSVFEDGIRLKEPDQSCYHPVLLKFGLCRTLLRFFPGEQFPGPIGRYKETEFVFHDPFLAPEIVTIPNFGLKIFRDPSPRPEVRLQYHEIATGKFLIEYIDCLLGATENAVSRALERFVMQKSPTRGEKILELLGKKCGYPKESLLLDLTH